LVAAGKPSWFHMPLPTPVIVGDYRAVLQPVFVLFDSAAGGGRISSVHI